MVSESVAVGNVPLRSRNGGSAALRRTIHGTGSLVRNKFSQGRDTQAQLHSFFLGNDVAV